MDRPLFFLAQVSVSERMVDSRRFSIFIDPDAFALHRWSRGLSFYVPLSRPYFIWGGFPWMLTSLFSVHDVMSRLLDGFPGQSGGNSSRTIDRLKRLPLFPLCFLTFSLSLAAHPCPPMDQHTPLQSPYHCAGISCLGRSKRGIEIPINMCCI